LDFTMRINRLRDTADPLPAVEIIATFSRIA
jgi:hypothetical protein